MDSFEGERNCSPPALGWRLWRCGLWLLCSVLSASAGSLPYGPAAMGQLGFEPVELRRTEDNHLFVSGRANGRKVSCLMDTGWSFTTMQPGNGCDLPLVEKLQLGRVTFTNQSVRVENILFNRQPASFDVVLGLDFLRRHFAVLDCGRRRLFTRRAVLSDAAQKEFENSLRHVGYAAIPLRLKAPPALTLETRVNGEPVEMLLDSGAAWSCLDERQCVRLKLTPAASTTKITGAGLTGMRPVTVAAAKSFQLGDVELKEATFALMNLADWGLAAPGKALSEVQGLLGGEWLMATQAVIDFQQLKLWIKPRTRR